MKKLFFSILSAGLFLPLALHAGCIDGDCQNGRGTMLSADGTIYVGQWKDGVHHGQGSLFLPDGTFIKGEFAKGSLVKDSEETAATVPRARAGAVAQPPGTYPEASTRLLTETDLAGLNAAELKLMRNEIFARHSYIFTSSALKKHFAEQPWYTPRFKEVYSRLSAMEKANIKLIVNRTKQLR
ncbi:MAG: YARHG domain-containing protein [Desulfobacterales bacterium]|nr:YARHG domain-containing protein [Desulfobacterales bacterium]